MALQALTIFLEYFFATVPGYRVALSIDNHEQLQNARHGSRYLRQKREALLHVYGMALKVTETSTTEGKTKAVAHESWGYAYSCRLKIYK